MIQETSCADRFIDLLTTHVNNIDEITRIVNLAFHNLISRHYIENRINHTLPKLRERLAELRKIPIIEQRSIEWFNARKNIITASDFAQALGEGKFGTQKELYQKKCGYEMVNFDPYIAPLKWGCMFEPVASEIYARRNRVKIHEFGLLHHPRIPYFGASPDGITDHGVMLEIKCPYKRKITGEVPQQYYMQVQGQQDVCDLDECDYLECGFVTENDNEFWSTFDDYPFEQGVIIELPKDTADVPVYKYSAMGLTKDALRTWMLSNMHNSKVHAWRLKQYNVVRIYRDPMYLAEKFAQLESVWMNVERYRADKGAYDRETAPTTKRGATRRATTNDDSFSFRV